MSKREALARFHTWCAAGYRKAETRRLWSSGCVMSTQRSPLTNVLVKSGSCAEAGSILRHRPLAHCIVKEI